MNVRKANIDDIEEMHRIRMSVKENVLSDPSLVKIQDYKTEISERGTGWVVEIDNRVVGFATANHEEFSVWALFVEPKFEGLGIGKLLHAEIIRYFKELKVERAWLSTDPGTRASVFYLKQGWKQVGVAENGEQIFHYDLAGCRSN